MLEAFLRKSRRIEKTVVEEQSVYLYSESGITRLTPINENIVRVSFTSEKDFEKNRGGVFRGPENGFNWMVREDSDYVFLDTDVLTVRVSKDNGSSVFFKDDKVLLCENPNESKAVEAFDFYKTIDDCETKIEQIHTADGIKRRIREAHKEFDRKYYHTKIKFLFNESEVLYGLGQSPEGVWNWRGKTEYLNQGNMKVPIPMLISSNGYAVLLSTQSACTFEDSESESGFSTYADRYADYYFLEGDLKRVIKSMRYLTGKASLLPRWAFGYIQSQERYENAEELINTAKMFKDLNFPISAVVQDWLSWPEGQWGQKSFDPERYSEPKKMTSILHDMDIKMILSVWPNMSEGCPNYEEFNAAGLLLPNSNIYDAFSEKARKMYWKQAKEGIFDYGVDGWWEDNCEPVAPEWEKQIKPCEAINYCEFIEAATKLMEPDKINAYCLNHAKSLYEGQRSLRSEKRVFNLTRSVYPGSQSLGTVVWSGDISASWDTLSRQVKAGVAFCATGMPYWNLDIGGFFIKKGQPWYWNGDYNETTDDPEYIELYMRWFEFAAFLPLMRAHGTDARREPWNISSPGTLNFEILRKRTEDRYRLMPYIYSLAGLSYHKDEEMLRPLTYDFPNDKECVKNAEGYMFGPSLYVNPVCLPEKEHKGKMMINLPKKEDCVCWYDFYTGKRVEAKDKVEVSLEIDHIPVFVPAGAIIPMDEKDGKTLYVYEGADGEFEIYNDSGDGYDYENGEYCFTKVNYNHNSHEIDFDYEGKAEYKYEPDRIVFIK